jgi:hypothetical protein
MGAVDIRSHSAGTFLGKGNTGNNLDRPRSKATLQKLEDPNVYGLNELKSRT